jgi:LAO/AO transport system kinase
MLMGDEWRLGLPANLKENDAALPIWDVAVNGGPRLLPAALPAAAFATLLPLLWAGRIPVRVLRLQCRRSITAPIGDAVSDAIASWVERIRAGNPRALAQAITAVEERTPEARELLRALFPYSGRARIVGLTGSPGSGKSTLVDQLAREYRKRELSVGIIAVDPTSPFTGGAILGDRIRMQRHHADPGIYIRSMATRGSLGGLAASTADVATVLDASGRDVVLIETVGVGQDEIEIVRLADVTLVILVPGMGDDVQSIKAGIMEIADIFVINKIDRGGAERVEQEIRVLQSTAPAAAVGADGVRRESWTPPVVKTVASEGQGIAELADSIARYQAFLDHSEMGRQRRIENWRTRLATMLRAELMQRIRSDLLTEAAGRELAAKIVAHECDPYTTLDELLGKLALS